MSDAQIEKRRVPDIYRKIAPSYDLWAWLTESQPRERCLELAAIRDGEDVLEVAVGTGLAFERILQANPSGRNEGIDLLINNYMFDLLPEQDFLTVLREFKRVLRPGGRLAMVNMTKGERWYNGIWNRIYRINPALLGGCRGVSLLPQLEACGFVKCKREYMSQFTFPSEIVYGIVA